MSPLNRRSFLTGAGVAVALPFLPSLEYQAHSKEAAAPVRRRMVAVNLGLGIHAENFIPQQAGRNYEPSTYLKLLEAYRDQYTVISGTSHPAVGGGHFSAKSYLTAAGHPNSAGFRNTISLDQLAAEKLGTQTRFASLALSSIGPGLSWSRSGVEIPTMTRPSHVFKKLFVAGKPTERAEQLQRLRDGQSVLDVVMEKTRSMEKRLGAKDREKLDQYFQAVREAEQRLAKAEDWESRPKPEVNVAAPRDETDGKKILERMELMYDMMHLAIQTDSTRFLTCFFTGMNSVPVIQGITIDYHNLSHHGKDPEKLKQLTVVESAIFKTFGKFLKKLNETDEGGVSLLERTMVLFGSNLGNASSHDSRNMPMMLAGGGFRHGSHLAFDQQNNAPLSNLYVSMLQRLGLEMDQFVSSTGTLNGLEMN